MIDALPTLASSPESRAVLWTIVLIVVLLIGLGAIAVIHAAHRRAGDAVDAPAGLTLHELREMRARGEISDEEFERARAIVLRQSGVSAPADAPVVAMDDEPGGTRPPGVGDGPGGVSGDFSGGRSGGETGNGDGEPDEGRPPG